MGCWMIFQLLKIPWVCRFGKLQAPSCPAPTSPAHPSSQNLFLHFCPQTNLSLSHSLWSILLPARSPSQNQGPSWPSGEITPSLLFFPDLETPQNTARSLETQLLSPSGFHTDSLIHLPELSANPLLPSPWISQRCTKPASPAQWGLPLWTRVLTPSQTPSVPRKCEKQSKAQLVNVQNVFASSPKSERKYIF